MSETFSWWLAIEAMGLLALPLCMAVFAGLNDRGYALSKPFGLLLTGYLFWLLNSAHVFPNSRGGIVWIVILVGIAAGLLARARWNDLRSFLARRWRYILVVEVLFLVAFAMAAWLRSFVPDVNGTEKPMDFMFVNAASHARNFPPHDPWLAGYHVSYYYFGYLFTAMVGKLAGVSTDIGYNLVARGEKPPALAEGTDPPDPPSRPKSPPGSRRAATAVKPSPVAVATPAAPLLEFAVVRPYLFGLVAALFVVLIGNLEGIFEFLAAHNSGPHGLYSFLDIKGLAPYQAVNSHWYPADSNSNWWWFRASRVLPHQEITEFPNFSFVLGDLHPHVTAIPFVLLAAGLAFALYTSQDVLSGGLWLQRPALLLWAAISLGGLSPLNAWDMPTMTAVMLGAVLLANYRLDHQWPGALKRTAAFAAPLLVAMFVLYIPFYRSFSSQASGIDVVSGHTTRLVHLLIFWGPFAALLVPFVALRLAQSFRKTPFGIHDLPAAVAIPLLIIALWLVWTAFSPAHGNPITDRSTGWLTDFALAAFLGASLLALWRGMQDEDEPSESRTPALFALLLTVLATALVLGTEFYYLRDNFQGSDLFRMNTVFKLYYQAWLLGAIASAFALYYLLRWWRPLTQAALGMQVAWGGVVALVLLAALLYPVGAVMSRTRGFGAPGAPPRSLSALADVQRSSPDEYAAIQWLRQRPSAAYVIAEGQADDYRVPPGRISETTGIPTLIEWPGHEAQWRGEASSKDWFGRVDEVKTLFSTTDPQQAQTILRKYGVTFVYVGPAERQAYPAAGLAKFDSMMDVAFKQGSVTIYRVKATG